MTFYRRGICVECAPQTELAWQICVYACVRVYRKDLCVPLILSHFFGLFKNCLFHWMCLCSPLPANIHLICISRLQHFLPKHFCFSLLLFFSPSALLAGRILFQFFYVFLGFFFFWHCHTYKFILSRKYTTFQGLVLVLELVDRLSLPH